MLATRIAVTVREAEEADFPQVIAVLGAANAEFAGVLPPAFYDAYLGNVLDVRGRAREATLFVAAREGRVVGTITLYPDASREGWGWPAGWAGIRAVAVAPLARGEGIGRRLAREGIARAHALGAAAVCLHTASFMAAAVAMYEHLGFQRIPDYDRDLDRMFPHRADAPLTALAYRLDLESRAAREAIAAARG